MPKVSAPLPRSDRKNFYSNRKFLKDFYYKNYKSILVYSLFLAISSASQLLWRREQHAIGDKISNKIYEDIFNQLLFLVGYFVLPRAVLIYDRLDIANKIKEAENESAEKVMADMLASGDELLKSKNKTLLSEVATGSFESQHQILKLLLLEILPPTLDYIISLLLLTTRVPFLSLPFALLIGIYFIIDLKFNNQLLALNKSVGEKTAEYRDKVKHNFEESILRITVTGNDERTAHEIIMQAKRMALASERKLEAHSIRPLQLKLLFLLFILFWMLYTLAFDYSSAFRVAVSSVSYLLWAGELLSGACVKLITALHAQQIKNDKINKLMVDTPPFIEYNLEDAISYYQSKKLSFHAENAGFEITQQDGTVKTIFKDLNFVFKFGEKILIMGRNGSGKSTLYKCMKCLENLTHGTMYYQTHDGERIYCKPENRKLIRALTALVEQSPKAGTKSGGEAQAARVIKILEGDALVKAFDEPTSAVDEDTVDSILSAISAIHSSESTVLVTTHDKHVKAELIKSGFRVFQMPTTSQSLNPNDSRGLRPN